LQIKVLNELSDEKLAEMVETQRKSVADELKQDNIPADKLMDLGTVQEAKVLIEFHKKEIANIEAAERNFAEKLKKNPDAEPEGYMAIDQESRDVLKQNIRNMVEKLETSINPKLGTVKAPAVQEESPDLDHEDPQEIKMPPPSRRQKDINWRAEEAQKKQDSIPEFLRERAKELKDPNSLELGPDMLFKKRKPPSNGKGPSAALDDPDAVVAPMDSRLAAAVQTFTETKSLPMESDTAPQGAAKKRSGPSFNLV
jgi:hypothetical protein